MKKTFSQPSLSRDFALLSGVIILILFLIGLWVSYETYRAYSEKTVRELETEALRIDRTLVIELEHASYLVESLARQVTAHGAGDPAYIAKLLRSFNPSATVNNVFTWIDDNQQITVSSNRGVLERPIDASDRDFVKKSLIEPWKVQIGRPIEGRASGKWVIPVAMGLTDDTGRFVGTLNLSVDIASLTDQISRTLSRPGISFAITTLTFTHITEHAAQDNFFENNFSRARLAATDFRDAPKGVLSRADIFSPARMFTFYEVSSKYPYIIFLGYNLQSNGEVFRSLMPRLLQLLIVAAFVLTLLWLIRLRVIRPVIDLSEAAASIARGEKAVSIHKSGPQEIEGLAQQLKKISDYLEERRRIEEELQSKMQILRRAKEAADLTNRIKVDFLSSMSHELRTPLNTIVAFSEVMKNQYYGPIENDKYLQYSNDIHQSGQHLLEIINDVVALSQAESSTIELREKPLRLVFALTKCLRLLHEKIQQCGVEVKTELPDDLPRLLIDELRLKQILINLLSHSLKLTPPGGEIQITGQVETSIKGQPQLIVTFRCLPMVGNRSERGEDAVISQLRHIRQQESTRREKNDFSGIALPLSKTLAAMNQATLHINALPGGGTVISLRFSKDRLVFWTQQNTTEN